MRKVESPTLSVNKGKNVGQQVAINKDEFIIGREADCDLVLAEQQVSRQHIKIKRIHDSYYIEDLESRNGTWLNNEPLKGERELKEGDQIDLAQVVRMTFFDAGSTAPISMIRGLRLDRESRRVFVNNQELDPPLSLPQYRLLELLVEANGAVCTREEVVRVVWPDAMSDGVSEQAIDALVRRLRDRIAEVDPDHQYIITVRGHGFRVEQG